MDGHYRSVTSVVFSPDGSQIASGSYDNTARIWDARTGQEVAKMNGHTRYVTSVVFSPDGSQIASGSEDNTARIWDARTGQELANMDGYTNHVTSAVFSSDAQKLPMDSLQPTPLSSNFLSKIQSKSYPTH
jgi:WD40 repeat protein